MSRKLDLRTGRPVWTAYRTPRVATSPLVRDERTDVLVVGMGISGAMIAEALTADGHNVTMVDRRGPLKGSTPATTALVQYEIDQPLIKLRHIIGREKAERAWRRSRLAVANLESRIGELGISCAMTRRASVYIAGNALTPTDLKEEVEARRRAGLHARYLPPASLREAYGLSRDGAIESGGNLALDPRKLTAGMLQAASARGARLHDDVEVTSIEDDADGVTVHTKAGPTIAADHVVLATGYELADGVPARGHRIISTWAMATKPQPRAIWPGAAFLWEASEPYLYLRATQDGRVICGGEDEDFTDEDRRDALIGEKIAAIRTKLGRLLPGIDTEPAYAWAGSFGSTGSGLPIAGALPRRPRVFAAMGYGGNGITWSRIAAELVSGTIAGRGDSDADLFAFPG